MRRTGLVFYLVCLSLSVILTCAVNDSPSGGPADTTPPTVVNVEPEPGSTGISADIVFSIEFSKPMRPDAVENSIFLSPVFWDYPEFKWSGRKLTIKPPEKLKENTTYVLTVGAGATDTRRNKMGKSYSFPFSTGAMIDSGSVWGGIFSLESNRTSYDIWAYRIDSSTISGFMALIPDYGTQVDSAGGFSIQNMAAGDYIVVAVDDKNDDLFCDPSSESMALPPGIVSVAGSARIDGIILRPERRDTIPAFFSRVEPLNDRLLSVEFSQPVDDRMELDTVSYYIQASDSSGLAIMGAYLSESGRLNIETDYQSAERSYRLKPNGLISEWGVRFDTSGGSFKGNPKPDSAGPKLISTFPPGGSRSVYQDTVVELTFSERINPRGFAESVSMVSDSLDTLPFIPKWTSPNKAALLVPGGIPREKKIEVRLRPEKIFDTVGNRMEDSVVTFSFKLAPVDTVGSVLARIKSIGRYPVIGELKSLRRGGETYQASANSAGLVRFQTVMPGSYKFYFYEDKDLNGKWSPGSVTPFRPADRFSFLPDSIIVRSRWDTEIGEVDLPVVNSEKY